MAAPVFPATVSGPPRGQEVQVIVVFIYFTSLVLDRSSEAAPNHPKTKSWEGTNAIRCNSLLKQNAIFGTNFEMLLPPDIDDIAI